MTRKKSERELERTVDALAGGPTPRSVSVAERFAADRIESAPDTNLYDVDGERVEIALEIQTIFFTE